MSRIPRRGIKAKHQQQSAWASMRPSAEVAAVNNATVLSSRRLSSTPPSIIANKKPELLLAVWCVVSFGFDVPRNRKATETASRWLGKGTANTLGDSTHVVAAYRGALWHGCRCRRSLVCVCLHLVSTDIPVERRYRICLQAQIPSRHAFTIGQCGLVFSQRVLSVIHQPTFSALPHRETGSCEVRIVVATDMYP